jgi:hypothetical protein
VPGEEPVPVVPLELLAVAAVVAWVRERMSAEQADRLLAFSVEGLLSGDA